MAVKDACDQINERLRPSREKLGPDAKLKEIAHAAYVDRVNVAANGFWKMPKVGYNWGDTNWETVKPMYYYWTQGAAASEVELDLLTGDHTVLRSDIMMVRQNFPSDCIVQLLTSSGRGQLDQPRN
jgi:xanthine dehydrogenase/oxidase